MEALSPGLSPPPEAQAAYAAPPARAAQPAAQPKLAQDLPTAAQRTAAGTQLFSRAVLQRLRAGSSELGFEAAGLRRWWDAATTALLHLAAAALVLDALAGLAEGAGAGKSWAVRYFGWLGKPEHAEHTLAGHPLVAARCKKASTKSPAQQACQCTPACRRC